MFKCVGVFACRLQGVLVCCCFLNVLSLVLCFLFNSQSAASFAGGLDWAAREVLQDNPRAKFVTLFGLKHYPYLCKADEYGKRVTLYGR